MQILSKENQLKHIINHEMINLGNDLKINNIWIMEYMNSRSAEA